LSAPGEIRVLLVGGDPLARSGLAALLAGEPGLALAGQAAPDEAASAVERLRPDVLLWDLGAGAASTADPLALPNLEDEDTGPPALVLVPSEDLAAEALAAGARGLLFRDAGAARLAAALQALALGLVVVDEALAAALARPGSADAADHPERAELIEPLTPREVEVLQLLAQGLSNPAIGLRLGVSEHTAKFHVTAILGKLGASGRTDAVVKAARLGLILL